MLEEEQQEDTELRDRFKEKWRREMSSKLTESLKKEASSNYRLTRSRYSFVKW